MKISDITKYAYNLALIASFSDGTIADLSKYLRRSRIEMNMLSYVMPFYRFKMSMEPELIAKIVEDSENVQFSFSSKIISINAPTAATYSDYMDTVILKPLIMDKNPQNINERLLKEKEASNQRAPFEVVCVPQYCLDVNKLNISGVFNNLNVTEAVLMLANKLNIKTEMYPLDNEAVYRQIMLIPQNPLSNIRHMQATYGLYNSSLKMFMLDKILFIGPMNGISGASYGNVNILIRFPVSKEPIDQHSEGSYRMHNPKDPAVSSLHINAKIGNVSIQNRDEINTEVYGNNNIFLNRHLTGGITLEQYKDNKDSKVIKTKAYTNLLNANTSINQFRGAVNDNTNVNVSFSDINITLSDCYKRAYLHFDSMRYKNVYSGEYQINAMVLEFTTSPNAATSMKGMVALRNIKRNDISGDAESKYVNK